MRRRTLLRSAAAAGAIGGIGFTGASASAGRTHSRGVTPTQDQESDQFSIASPEWENGETIPTRFSCDGENVSPRLTISNPPEETQSFALVMDDPDAPNPPFVHWLLWDIPADTQEIPEAVPSNETVEELDGAVQGANGTDELGYVGPCPPEGDDQHTYLFSLFALEESLGLDPGAEYDEVLTALFPRAIARSRYVGQFKRG